MPPRLYKLPSAGLSPHTAAARGLVGRPGALSELCGFHVTQIKKDHDFNLLRMDFSGSPSIPSERTYKILRIYLYIYKKALVFAEKGVQVFAIIWSVRDRKPLKFHHLAILPNGLADLPNEYFQEVSGFFVTLSIKKITPVSRGCFVSIRACTWRSVPSRRIC